MTAATLYSAQDIESMTPDELAFIDALIDEEIWLPLPGPQTMAYNSEADIIGYGGAAGGGKTDLACGKALTQHQKVMILRRVGTELTAIEDRLEDIIGNKEGYNGQKKIWRVSRGKQIEFASVPHAGDEKGYQGRPHDLLVFDEAANFLESQVRFLLGWLRSVDAKQKCQALLTFNPPTSAEGRWIIDFFAPWLDKKYPNPAQPGELRWFATVGGVDREMPDGRAFVVDGKELIYDFDPTKYKPTEVIKPLTRTFIPSRVSDNPYLYGTGYMNQLQSLPEPLRSQMLDGDFQAGMGENPWQVCPTAWVEAAMARWVKPVRLTEMLTLGVDVARGGKDKTVIARKHEPLWFDEPLVYPGTETPDGPTVAGLVIAATRDNAPQHIDVIGVGSSPYDFLNSAKQVVLGINVSERAQGCDKSGRLTFPNQRSELWWKMREALDPANNTGICLPPDPKLKADLCAPCWELQGRTIYVESREEIVKRIHRSPDHASAYILALIDTPKLNLIKDMPFKNGGGHDPYSGGTRNSARADYNPYSNL